MTALKAKNIFLGLLATVTLSLAFVSCQQDALEDLNPTKKEQPTEALESRNFNVATDVIGTWWRSHEEETNSDTEYIFRPDTYNFPPARGRYGFEFAANGDFAYFYPGPADQPMQQTGTWRNFGVGNNILIFFDADLNAPPRPRLSRIKVISVDSNMLVTAPFSW